MSETVAINPGERLLPVAAVMDKVGLGRSTIYRKIAAGAFPAPVVIGESTVRWLESEVDAWIKTLPRMPRMKPAA